MICILNEFYKIGQVIEARGQRVRVRVFENKNSNILVYDGQIIKNVSVGGFVKIPKGYSYIIARIEGEYIQESDIDHTPKSELKFSRESENIDRVIEVSIMGVLDGSIFKRGLIDIPLVFSDVYMLMPEEVRSIFQFSRDRENAISIGALNDYKEEKLYIDINTLFASHIGIFGNTGSGKSNTLAKIYSECFDKYADNNGFEKSRFVLIDFNGEYKNAFGNGMMNKKVYNLSTRKEDGDKIPMPSSFLEDLEIWAIICEATEKTQKPFLGRTIRTYKNIRNASDKLAYIKALIESQMVVYFENPYLYIKQIIYLKELMILIFINTQRAFEIMDSIQLHSSSQKLFRKDETGELLWVNDLNEFVSHIINPIIQSLYITDNYKDFSDYIFFEFSLKYQYISELSKQRINEEHIAPLISRFESRIKSVHKLFEITENENQVLLEIFSLFDVNVEFKKIIPLIICKYYYDAHKQMPEKESLHIIIDEAHNILSTTSERESQTWKDYRLETFEEIIKEGRKFGVFLTISSQRPSDISETIISQLHNYFIHRLVNNEDIRAIGRSVAFIDSTSYEMISVLPQGACIFTGVASNFPVMIQVDILSEDKRPQSETIDLVNMWRQ